MKKPSDLEKLVDMALQAGEGAGESSAEGADPRPAQYRLLVEAMKLAHFDAPREAIERAKALMSETGRAMLLARLKGGSLLPAGARTGSADNFQLVFQAEQVEARLMYVRGPQGWEVAGQAPAGWTPERRGRRLRVDREGRFVFQARALGDTALSLRGDSLDVHIPAATEAESDEPRRTD